MALRRDTIPENILDAAKEAGLDVPHGYVGRNNGRYAHRRKKTVGSIIQDVRSKIARKHDSSPARADQGRAK
jgi:hypothetical protein